MESPLEVQKSIYGEDGPPMVFFAEASALHLEMRAPPPTLRACCAPKTKDPSNDSSRRNPKKRVLTEREIFARVGDMKRQQQEQQHDAEKSSSSNSFIQPQLSPCQLPGDFPQDLSFRSLAAYSLLRTLSIQLRLSPFTPNAFLRALALPAPNKLLGDVHVALLRILFCQKLKHMGYSYKAGGGGVGVNKKRQLDGIRWPLLAGDNLTHLDGHSWPLFYDDYCHLTADKLWASYHGPINAAGDEGPHSQNFIDFRNIGVFVPPRGQEYETKTHADGTTIPKSVPSGGEGAPMKDVKPELESTADERKHNEARPLHVSSSVPEEGPEILTETMPMLDSDDSDWEEEYRDNGDNDDDDHLWDNKPRKKKRRKNPKNSTTSTTETTSATKVTSLVTKEGKNASFATTSSDSSRINSLKLSTSTPAANPTVLSTTTTDQSPPFDPSGPGIASIEPSHSAPKRSPSKELLENTTAQQQKSSSFTPSQPAMSSAPNQIQMSSSATSSQEDQPRKSIQPMMETERSEQQQQQPADVSAKDDDMTTANDPARIRGGGGDSRFTSPSSASGSGRQTMGRPRGSRRALPMRSAPPTPVNYASHTQHMSMLQQQQMQQQQQYLSYQAQNQQNFGQFQGTTPQYKPSNSNPSGNPRLYQFQPQTLCSNEKLKIERGTRTFFEFNEEEPDMPFVAPDTIAKIVNDAVGGSFTHTISMEGTENIDEENDSDSDGVEVDPVFEKEIEDERWIHFKPLKAMRFGIPYHRLPIEDKVCILEFLIDELLTVDAIADEFSRRRNRQDYHTSPFGILPKEHEYQNMENKDECSVCGQEGDLLCCDGCLSSFHSYCLGMQPGEVLPEGKWLCPECSIIDPSNYGSLHGGQKSSLDWFTLDDVVNPSKAENQNFAPNSLVSSLYAPALQNLSTQVRAADNPHGGPESMKTGVLSKWNGRKFIVVHGFVFCKEIIEGNVTFEALKSSKPCSSLTKAGLGGFTSEIDEGLFQAWPLVQIPFRKKSACWKFPSVKGYFASKESINPFLYRNKYIGAPISQLTKVGAAQNMVKLMYLTFETECNKLNTHIISELLTQDCSFDSELSASLRTRRGLFDPFQVLKGYMLKLEHTLRRSCMLNEFWESGKLQSRSDMWVSAVQSAHSIRALSRLLLKLVNAMHTRAFSASWFHSHIARSPDAGTSMTERNYKSLPNDWSVEKEKLKHTWENTPSKMILRLCSDFDNGLMVFASKIRSDIFIPKQTVSKIKSKKKPKKVASSMMLKKNQHINEGNVLLNTVDSAKQEQKGGTIRDPSVPAPAIKKEHVGQHTKQGVLQTSKMEFESSGRSFSDHGEQGKPVITNFLVEGDNPNPNIVQESDSPIVLRLGYHPEQNESVQVSELPTNESLEQNNISQPVLPSGEKTKSSEIRATEGDVTTNVELKNGSKPQETIEVKSETIEGKYETMESTSLGNSADGNATTASTDPGPARKKKRKKSIKPKPREPLTRRRTRHSDRLLSESSVGNSTCTNASEPKESNELDALEGMALQLENAKKQKIPGLEKLLKGQYAVEGIWPIAGRRIFPTVGNIPPREMRRIARNAGSAMAANLSYHTNHEVAQVCYGHIWRKRVQLCNGFEELLFLMRILESSLDREMIHQCETQTRRGKYHLQKVIRCTIRNPSSGSLDHFLLNKKRLRGCWVPGDQLDMSTLIHDLFCRRQKQKEKLLERVRAKERLDREKLSRERHMRMAEAAQRAQEEKLRKEEARRISKLQKQEDVAKKKLEQEAKKRARLLAAMESRQSQQNNPLTALNTEISSCQKQRHHVFSSHEMQVEHALRSWHDRGFNKMNSLPEKQIVKIRQATVDKIRIINDRLRRCNAPVMESQQILARMFSHEKIATMKIKKSKEDFGSMPKISQNSSASTLSPADNGNFDSRTGGPFSTLNSALNAPSFPGFRANEQNRLQQTFGKGNFSQDMNPKQSNLLGQNVLSPEPITNRMPSLLASNRQFPPGGHGYVDANQKEFGFQTDAGLGGVVNQSHPQQLLSDFQTQVQNQNYGNQNFPTPNSKKNQFSAPGGNVMFTNSQQVPEANQRANSMTKSLNNTRYLSPMQLAQRTPQQQQEYRQQDNSRSLSPMQHLHHHRRHHHQQQQTQQEQRRRHQQGEHSSSLHSVQRMQQSHQEQQQNNLRFLPPMQGMQQQQSQQKQRNIVAFPNQQGLQTHENRFSQTSNLSSKNNAQQSRPNDSRNQYPNSIHKQHDSMRSYEKSGLNQQHFTPNTTSQAGNFIISNTINQAGNESTFNTFNNNSSMASQYNKPSKLNQSLFGRNGVIEQHQHQPNQQQQQLHINQYPLNNTNYSIPSTGTNSFNGATSHLGKYGSSNMNRMNSISQSRNILNQASNTGYGQQQQQSNAMNQNASNFMSGQNQQDQQQVFGRNNNFPNGANQPSRMSVSSQNTHEPMSMATGFQQQGFRISSSQGQQQYSQSQQQQQQNPRNQLGSLQQKLYILQQQQRQQNLLNGQLNSGSNGNNFYR